MADSITTSLDENTRRYYLDVMGVQCWEPLDASSPGDVQADQLPVQPDTDVAIMDWAKLDESVQTCESCALHKTRNQALTGRGNQSADLMFLILSPGTGDDVNASLCSAEEYELLSKMLSAINITIDDVYISSLLKCAVPANHTVSPKEILSCNTHLSRQIQMIRPKLVVVLGETAVRCLFQKNLSLDDFRAMNPGVGELGQSFQLDSIPVFVSYAPEELLMQAEDKRKAWSDLQQIQKIIDSQGW